VLGLINDLQGNQTLPAGSLFKRVVNTTPR